MRFRVATRTLRLDDILRSAPTLAKSGRRAQSPTVTLEMLYIRFFRRRSSSSACWAESNAVPRSAADSASAPMGAVQ